jgi:hypothetical protein
MVARLQMRCDQGQAQAGRRNQQGMAQAEKNEAFVTPWSISEPAQNAVNVQKH